MEHRAATSSSVMQTAANHGLASMIDRRVIAELIGWLHRNPNVWKKDSPAFSVNLSDAAVTEPHFISFVESCLVKSALRIGQFAEAQREAHSLKDLAPFHTEALTVHADAEWAAGAFDEDEAEYRDALSRTPGL